MKISQKNVLILSALLPGIGQLFRNEKLKGTGLFLCYGGCLVLLVFNREQVLGAFTTGFVDHWIAAMCLMMVPILLWFLAFFDLYCSFRRDGKRKSPGQWRIAWLRFVDNPLSVVGIIIVLALYLMALLAPVLAPYHPDAQIEVLKTRYLSPSKDHPMGTDKFGRDIFSRVLYGARISLAVGLLAVCIAVTLGTLIGGVAGYCGGFIDNLLMRFVDIGLAFPRLVLVLTVVALLEPRIWLVICVIGFTGWMPVARLVRGEMLTLKERAFVQAARSLGAGSGRILFRHLLPNAVAPIIVAATLMIGDTILIEAALSFLGLGVQPPTASWGSIINQGRDTLLSAWWISTFPGLAIVVTVVGYNVLGDGLRDALDPKRRWQVR